MRDFAVFTIVRNEPFFLPIWCDYYARNFGEENLYILDNSTSDNSIIDVLKRWPRLNIKSVPSEEALLFAWTTQVAKSFQRAALQANRVVIFADADEFLIPSTHYAGIRDYCEQFLVSQSPCIRAQGWAPIHQIDIEPAVTATSFILENRNLMWRAPLYDKTLVSKIPLNWAKGIHTVYGDDGVKLNDAPVDVDLSLVHLRDIDIDILHKRCIDRSKMKIADLRLTFGSIDIDELKIYFKTHKRPWDTDMSWVPGSTESEPELVGNAISIPNHWRRLLVRQ